MIPVSTFLLIFSVFLGEGSYSSFNEAVTLVIGAARAKSSLSSTTARFGGSNRRDQRRGEGMLSRLLLQTRE